MKSSKQKSLPEENICPYQQKNAQPTGQETALITSPQEAIPTVPVPRLVSHSPLQHNQGWSNFNRLSEQGPHSFFAKMAARTPQSFFKIQLGPKTVYQITDGKIANELLTNFAEHLGRGDLLVPFKSMVGDVFFANDGPLAKKSRLIFLNSVTRIPENFQRIHQVNERTFNSVKQKSAGHIPDFYAFVAWHTMSCIAACYLGIDNLSAIPLDTHITFMNATRLIAKASMDPVSKLLHPYLRPEFCAASLAMADIAVKLLESNIDSICQGNNYVWDLAVFRAQQLHPELNFGDCTHFDENNPQARIIRDLIINKDHFILEHGPLTIFASSNVGATLFYLIDILGRRLDLIDKMQKEIKEVLHGEAFTWEQLSSLPYVRAVVHEALWQATPIPTFPRQVLSSFQTDIDGKTVFFEKNETLMFLFRPMQGPPREFSPEVWLDSSPQLFSFGAGHRRCPARPFAEQMLVQFLVDMISNNLHIALTSQATYTTHNGLLGPNYQPNNPVSAELRPIEPEEHQVRLVAKL
jgi:hypothetical protein